jgi:hypothetical protein
VRRLAQENVELLTVRRSEDLRDQAAVFSWFAKARPQVVFLALAKVGGIVANNTLRAEFIGRRYAPARWLAMTVARGGLFPSAAAIADISGFMK